jgi:hypothetical protein
MKTIITLLTATMLIAGATGAMAADRQGSDEAANNDLSWQAARGSNDGGAYASARIPAGARASVRVPARARTGIAPSSVDFTADRDPAQGRN